MIMLIVLVSVSTAKAASVEVQVPLMGSIQGSESHTINFPTMDV
jgi:enolase